MTVDPIKVRGLVDFQAALRQMDGESQKQLRGVLNEAAEMVATAARRNVPSRTGQAASSVRAMSSQREARVMGGSKKVPYYGWLDFGGAVGRQKATRRPFIRTGRYMGPAYEKRRPEILAALESGLVDLAHRAGLDVT